MPVMGQVAWLRPNPSSSSARPPTYSDPRSADEEGPPVRYEGGVEESMVVPLAGRVIAAIVGGLLVFTAAPSAVVTVIVPRPVGSWLTRWVDKSVSFFYGVASKKISDHKRRDRVLAGQAATI